MRAQMTISIDSALLETLDRFLAEQTYTVTRSAFVQTAVMERLASEGVAVSAKVDTKTGEAEPETIVCPSCEGSGEGYVDGSKCRDCKGSGEWSE